MSWISEYWNFGAILLIIAGASYIQAITGFAFALIVMGVVPGLNLMAVADTASIVMMLAIVNTGTALSKGFTNIRWKEVGTSLMFSVPAVLVGLYLLDLLSAGNLGVLRMGLGVTILFSGIMLLRPPHQDARVSKMPTFALFGFLAGLFGGLFSTGGPPVVFHFYRQPWPLPVIRDNLFLMFFIGSSARTTFVALDSGIETRLLILAAISLPVVIAFTKIGQRYAPGLSHTSIRRAVFVLLMLTALTLMLG